MSKLLQTDIHHLADTRRFSQPTSASRMTLDGEIDPEWTALFERSETEEQWNTIMRCVEHLTVRNIPSCKSGMSRA
jgi:hypothetical protein